ncbi:hypothetical protein POPTR_001G249000v4 [Populus trichocarpa]|uniref:Uncharacterized protein n=1 Tax=Populus trichocarpa TaxID=3694 RepID=A0ACC0TM55_POPTR|nr:hypothetical protein POPTR_001G249000v4 [Populus trichocarpa]
MKMGIDAKEFQAFMWRVVKFSINTCTALAQKYPFASGVLLSLLILYLFLPSVFFFLIYSLPFLGCTAVFIHYYLNTQRPKIQHGDERKEHGISSIESRRLLQRNVNKNNIDESDAHAVKEEKDMVSPMISNDELIGRTALAEEKPKIIMEEKESRALNSGESSSHNVSIGENISELGQAPNPDAVSCDGFNEQPTKLQVGGEVELESSSSEADDDDEEEESEKGGENAVQWTEYDQKNVMDLGNSEIERNRRLEMLIARRKARKSFKMNSIAGSGPRHPVMVARSNTFHVSKSSDDQIPGSAPSILLPTKNPFDLPYDPHEEKPNLMADSFHEEFMADHQKEFPFCRHESFSLGNSFQDNRQGQHEGRGSSRPKMQSGNKGNHDRLVDHLLFQGGETLRRNLSVTDLVTEEPQSSNQVANKQERDREVGTTRIKLIGEKMEQSHYKDPSLGNGSDIQMNKDANAIKHKKILSNPSSSAEDILNAKTAENSESIQPTTFKFPEVFYDRAPNSLPCPVPKARAVAEPSYDSSPSPIDNTRMEEHFFYKLKPGHTPNHSIASDMQVEVSEIGSPPLIEDGTASSNDDESLIYDGDSENEFTSGSEELWGSSPLAPKVQEHGKARGQIYEEGEEGMTEVEFSRVWDEPENPISSSMWPLSSSRAEISQEDQAHSMKIDPKLSNHVKDEVDEVREQRPSNASDVDEVEEVREERPSNSSDVVPPEHSLEGTRLMEGSMAHSPSEVYFPEPQEPYDTQGKCTEEAIDMENMNGSVLDDEQIKENLKCRKNIEYESETLISNEASVELSEPLEEPQTADHLEGASARLVDNEASINLSKPDEEHVSSKVPGVLVEKEESTNPPRDVAGEVNHISDVSDPSINKNDDLEKLKSFEGSEGEPDQFSTGHEIFVEPLKPANITSLEGHEYSPGVLTENETIVASSQAIEEVDNSRTSKETDEFGTQIADEEIEDLLKPGEAVVSSETTKNVQGDPKDLIDQKAVLNPSTPAVDDDNILVTPEAKDSAADTIHNVNESEMSEFISNEKFKHVQDSEDESQRLDRQEDIMEPLKAVEVTNSESIRDIEGESKKLADDEVNVTIPSQPEGEINSSDDREKTEDPGKSIVQENGMDISEVSRGNDIARAVEDNKDKSEDKTEING